jgi:hypothetical protein
LQCTSEYFLFIWELRYSNCLGATDYLQIYLHTFCRMAVLPKPIVHFPSQVCMHGHSNAITDKLDPISLACVLFILIRYVLSSPSCDVFHSHSRSYLSIATMVISNYGFFSTGFTSETCQGYYLLAPSFKGLSSLIYIRILLTTL